MDAFDYDKRRASKSTREHKMKKFIDNNLKKYEEKDFIQDNVISSTNLQDNSEETEIQDEHIMAGLVKKSSQRNIEKKTHLKYKWIYWGYKEKSPYYKKNLKVINSFDTAEEFCSIYQEIKTSRPKLVDGDVYCVFKEGIMPLVDDPGNEHGGEWMISFERDRNGLPANMENEWLSVLLAVIAGNFGEDDSGICGIDIDIRGNRNRDVISVWTAKWNNYQQLESIRSKIVNILKPGKNVTISYQTHH